MIGRNSLFKRISALTKSERAVILILGVIAAILPADQLIITPMVNSIKALAKMEPVLIKELISAQKQLSDVSTGAENKRLKDLLQAKHDEDDLVITPLLNDARAHLLAPEQVSKFLRDMVPQSGSLRLVSLKSAQALKEDRAPGLFRHPFDVEFEGSYAELVEHMKRLQGSVWRMSIDRMVLDAEAADGKTNSRILMHLHLSVFSDSPTWLATPAKLDVSYLVPIAKNATKDGKAGGA